MPGLLRAFPRKPAPRGNCLPAMAWPRRERRGGATRGDVAQMAIGAFSYFSGIEWAVEAGDVTDAATLEH